MLDKIKSCSLRRQLLTWCVTDNFAFNHVVLCLEGISFVHWKAVEAASPGFDVVISKAEWKSVDERNSNHSDECEGGTGKGGRDNQVGGSHLHHLELKPARFLSVSKIFFAAVLTSAAVVAHTDESSILGEMFCIDLSVRHLSGHRKVDSSALLVNSERFKYVLLILLLGTFIEGFHFHFWCPIANFS